MYITCLDLYIIYAINVVFTRNIHIVSHTLPCVCMYLNDTYNTTTACRELYLGSMLYLFLFLTKNNCQLGVGGGYRFSLCGNAESYMTLVATLN